jgi:hypothetical protein
MQVKKYSKLKMCGLYLLSLLVNLVPLVIVLVINWEICTKTKREGIAISVTGFVWIFFLLISMLGSVPKKINRVATLFIVFAVLELMKPLLNYMTIFAGAAAIGAMLDILIVKPIIKRYAELRLATKSADLTTIQVTNAVKEILKEGTGRV